MKPSEAVSVHPEVMNGTPVFTGTRVPVEILTQYVRAGDSLEEFLDDFPSVTLEQAQALVIAGLTPEGTTLAKNAE